MAVTTVAQFAAELNRPATTLLEQLKSAGVAKSSPEDSLAESDKERLLDYLRSSHGTAGNERRKITLTKKSTTEIKQADASGKARTIQVEVRKKRVFVKREDVSSAAVSEEPPAPVIDEAEAQRREAEAARQAELLRRHAWLPAALARRLARAYGSRIDRVLDDARSLADLGAEVAPGLREAELHYLRREEWAVDANDILWRRSKLGLHYTEPQRQQVVQWLAQAGNQPQRKVA